MRKKTLLIVIGILAFHFIVLFNLQFTAWPEMVSFPYLKNNGFILYRDFVHPYTPLLTDFLSLIYKLFGYQIYALKIVTWALIVISDLLVFQIVRKITKNDFISGVALFIYALLQPFLQGNQLWFDLAIVPFLLGGSLFLVDGKLFLSGLLFGFAALTKQNAGLFALLTFGFLVVSKKSVKEIFVFLSGLLFLVAAFFTRILQEGSLNEFLNWTLIYPSGFWTNFPGYVQLIPQRGEMLILVALVFPIIILIKQKYFLLSLFLFSSLLLFYPRFSFFHLQAFIAFSAISYGVVISEFEKKGWYFLIPLAISLPLVLRSNVWKADVRFWEPEIEKLAGKIKTYLVDKKSAYILGSPSSLYVFSESLPPKPWLDNYGWYFEVPGVEDATIVSWQKEKPEIIIWKNPTRGAWYDLGVYQPKKVTKWIIDNYNIEKEIEPGIWIWRKK